MKKGHRLRITELEKITESKEPLTWIHKIFEVVLVFFFILPSKWKCSHVFKSIETSMMNPMSIIKHS